MLIDAARPDARSPAAQPLAVIARPLGRQTNNYAEYTAVVLALERALELGAGEVEVVLDSKLAVEQLMGRWRVKEPTLAPLHARASELLRRFDRWTLRHEGRASNTAADALANLALDDPSAAADAEGRRAEEAEAALGGSDEAFGQAAIGAACLVFDDTGRVLLVREGYGEHNWALPGGSAWPGEAPLAAAARELREETGLQLTDGEFRGVYFDPNHPRFGTVLHFVFGFSWRADGRPVAQPPEVEDIGFFPVHRLPDPMSEFTRRRIREGATGPPVYGVVGRGSD